MTGESRRPGAARLRPGGPTLDEISAPRVGAEERDRARRVVRGHAVTGDDARLLLEALGLAPDGDGEPGNT